MFRRLNETGLDLIKTFEGFSPVPYEDEAGILTVGYGHKILPGESFNRITARQAQLILQSDIAKAEESVQELVKVPLTNNQFSALVSFVFNVGSGAFSKSTMLSKLNDGNYLSAAEEFARWNKTHKGGELVVSNILTKRRAIEKDHFLA